MNDRVSLFNETTHIEVRITSCVAGISQLPAAMYRTQRSSAFAAENFTHFDMVQRSSWSCPMRHSHGMNGTVKYTLVN